MFAAIRRMMVLLGSLAFFSFGIVHAADDVDKGAVQGVISRQLDAFKRDDAAAAYGFAAPQIKEKFADSAGFLAMVKQNYAPVYRPKSVTFGEFKAQGESFSQALTIVDGNGQVWSALYSLERGADGQLQISGCALVKSPETST